MNGLYFLLLGIHAFAPLVFLTHFTQNPYSIQVVILQSALLIAWAGVGVHLWRSRPLPVVRTALDFPLVLFGLWTLVTWGLSFWRHGAFFRSGIYHEGLRGALFVWVNAVGAFILSAQFSRGPRALVFRKLMIAVGGISAAYGLIQYFGQDPLWGKTINAFSGRPISTYGNPNFLSSVLVLLLPLLFHQFLIARKTVRAWGWGLMGFLYVAALTCTMTRSSWIGAGVAIALYSVFERRTVGEAFKRASVWFSGVCALVFFWPASTLGSSVPLARMTELWRGVTGEVVYASWHQRLLIWRSAWDMWTEAPWVGKGWGLFELFFTYYQGRLIPLDLFRTFRTHANNAHELFLEFGSQTGLIGLGLLLWVILVTVMAHRKAVDRISLEERSLATALLAGVGGMAADNVLGNVSLFFAVPGFLFFWVWGQWAGLCSGENRIFPSLPPLFQRLGAILLLGFSIFGITLLFRNLVGDAAFLKGSQLALGKNDRAAEERFLWAKKWKRFDVNTNFELGNLYSHRIETARTQGFKAEVQANAEKAMAAYTDALRSNPSYDELFESRARAFRYLSRDEESELDLRMAILINPLRKESILALENLTSKTKKGSPRRIDLLERAVAIFPEDILFQFLLAAELESAGRRAEAGKAYAGVLARDLDNTEAWAGLRRVIPLVPESLLEGKKILSKIRESASLSKWTEAHASAERLIELFPDYPLPRLMSADMAAQSGDDAAAIVRYQEFIQRNPDHKDARENLAKVMERHLKPTPGGIIDEPHPLR